MQSRLAQLLALLVVGVAAPFLHAGTVTFDYTAPDVGTTAISGTGSFSYNGSLASIALGNLTSFAFELDLSTPGALPATATFDFGPLDLLSFSASVSGGVVTALSLTTDYEAATNTSNFDENQKDLVVTSLAINGAFNDNDDDVLNEITLYDTGTITTQGPGAPAPEPSPALLAGGGALLLAFWRRTLRARQS
jgi:hypothetical protein